MSHDLQRLQNTHKRILELYLEGLRVKDIAEEVGMTEKSISRIINAPLFQDLAAKKREERERAIEEASKHTLLSARERLEEGADEAARVLVTLLKSDSDEMKRKAANDVLSRVFRADDEGGVKVLVKELNLALFQAALKESREVVDVEVVESA